MYTPEVVTDLTVEPVPLAEVKEFCAIDADYAGDDTLLTAHIKTARKQLEKYLNLSLGTTERKLFTDKALFDLPYGPIQAITSVKDKDDADVEYDEYGSIYPKIDVGCIHGGVTVLYTAGFEVLEEDLKTAIKLYVRGLYDKDHSYMEQAKDISFPYSRNLFI